MVKTSKVTAKGVEILGVETLAVETPEVTAALMVESLGVTFNSV